AAAGEEPTLPAGPPERRPAGRACAARLVPPPRVPQNAHGRACQPRPALLEGDLPPRGGRGPPPTRDELLGEAAVLRPAHDNGPVAAVAQLLDERAPVSDRPALGRVSRAGSQGREPGVREPAPHQPLRHTLRPAAPEA